MIKVNRYSDFTLQFKMADGKPLPQYPFSLIFQTAGGLRYYVDSEDKALFVRAEDNMSAVVVFDFHEQHNLPAGELRYTLKASLPNTIFPDGYQDINEPQTTGVELWDGASDFAEAIECDVILPYVKGEAGAGVPSGGLKGQVLTKRSDEDQDLEWTTPQSGGSAEGAVLYTPQTLTDEQKSQVAKNIGQPRERLILEWSNEDAEVLQPIAYDSATGYFTAESMPSWLPENGVSCEAVIDYVDAILLGKASSQDVVKGTVSGSSRIWIQRISETQFFCHLNKTNMTAAKIPTTVDVSLFYFTSTITPAFQLLKDGEVSPTRGVKKFHIHITDLPGRESRYTQLWLNGAPRYTQGETHYNKYPGGAIDYFAPYCFGTTVDAEVWVDYAGATNAPTGKFVRVDSCGVYFNSSNSKLEYYVNPTMYSAWGEMWGYGLALGDTQCYLRISALGHRATVRITEIID